MHFFLSVCHIYYSFREEVNIEFCFLLVGLMFEPRGLHLQSSFSITWATPPVHFHSGYLEIVSYELYAWADIKMQSSRFQVARITGVTQQLEDFFKQI
jgi:hypothetical protein